MADTRELNRIRRDVLVGCSILFSVIMVIAIIPRASTPGGGSAVALAGVWVAVSMLSLVLARSGRWLRASSLLYCISLFAILVLLQLNVGFFPAPALLGFFLVPTLAGFLLGGAAGLAFGLLGCGLAIGLKVSLPPWSDPNLSALTGTFLVVVCVSSLALPAIIAVYDRSHRRVNEALSRARAEAFGASAAKSEFLANMSHEIRTPMTAILGVSELILDEDVAPGLRERIELVHDSAEHLLILLNQILDFSKIEAGKMVLEEVNFELLSVVEGCISLLMPRAEAKGLELSYVVDPELPPRIIGDPARLRQVLLNLLSNAIKFTSEGSVTLTLEITGADRQRVLATVKDTGIGISAEASGMLFTPFQQADNSMTRRFGGTGLGLAISKEIARLFAGELRVESRLGEGASFMFEWPLRVATPTPREPTGAEEVAASLERRKVLVVEDNPVNLMVVKGLLAKLGLDVVTAIHGAEALERLEEGPVDAVLMDCQMPVMDGYEATRRIRKAEAGKAAHLPIIALTAHAFDGERERCLREGMDDFISKPYRKEELKDRLGHWLGVSGEHA